MADPDDGELLRRWADGDEVAGQAFVERHFDAVYRFFRSKIDRGVEDLTQQVFLICADAAHRYRGEGRARSYVLGIARHVLYKRFRSERRYAHALRHAEPTAEALAGSPSSILRARSEVELLERALRRLPLDLQILLELQYWEDASIREIAEVLEIPAGTVKSRLARARAELRAQIEAAHVGPSLRDSTLEGLDTWVSELRDAFGRGDAS
jgi:RNA polymerase sigma-70 factor (ECF subfamily)